jgi:hypothetical protein
VIVRLAMIGGCALAVAVCALMGWGSAAMAFWCAEAACFLRLVAGGNGPGNAN